MHSYMPYAPKELPRSKITDWLMKPPRTIPSKEESVKIEKIQSRLTECGLHPQNIGPHRPFDPGSLTLFHHFCLSPPIEQILNLTRYFSASKYEATCSELCKFRLVFSCMCVPNTECFHCIINLYKAYLWK